MSPAGDGGMGSDGNSGDAFDVEDGGDVDPVVEERQSNDAAENDLEEYDAENRMNYVSFGALKQAQDALQPSRKRKRDEVLQGDSEEKLEALRSRLRQIKDLKAAGKETLRKPFQTDVGSESKHDAVAPDGTEPEQESLDSDSAPSEEANAKSRASKHAPAAQSSKYQVTRKRHVIEVPKRNSRDPRFDTVGQGPLHNDNADKAYGFLQDYEKAEMAELRAALKTAKNGDDQATLRRKLVSMENRMKAREAKAREQDVLRQHRKEEKAKVEQGKQPYYLKKKEVKERALVAKFNGLKSKERTKLMEKRRKRESQKEKKRMPRARRVAP